MLVHYALHQLTDYVNWTFFLFAWNIKPKFATVADVLATHDCPACREGWISGFPEEEQAEARETLRLYLDAQDRLRRLDEAGIKVHALFRRFPAYSEGDNIIVTHPDGSTLTLPFLRQQHQQTDRPNLCLSDFIAPKGYVDADHVADYLGAFAVSVDTVPELDNPDDPYERMLIQVLLDRMAEAATERFHQDIRTTHWGYAPHETLTQADLLAERYQGIRPAVGYPSIPDQSFNFLLRDLIPLDSVGISLTENGMMRPHASVSGLVFAHPASHYFAIGQVSDEQLSDYARRRGTTLEQMLKFVPKK